LLTALQKKKRRGKRGQPKKRGSRASVVVGDETGGTDADAEDMEEDGQDTE
jgi:hypothetical protein